MSKIIGCILLASPFIGLFLIIMKDLGVADALIVFGITGIVSGIVLLGVHLILN